MKRTIISILFAAYGFIFINLIWNDKLLYYLHPKMNAYIYFACIIFFVSSISLIVFWKKVSIDALSLTVFFLPLFLFLIFPSSGVNDQFGYSKGVILGDDLVVYSDKVEPKEKIWVSSGIYENSATLGTKSTAQNYTRKDGNLNVENDNFKDIVQKIVNNPYDFYGYELSLQGTVIKSGQVPENSFIVSRTLITCCLADATIIGLLATHPDTDNFFQGSWYTINGKVNLVTSGDIVYPIINITDYSEISEPKDPYIYR